MISNFNYLKADNSKPIVMGNNKSMSTLIFDALTEIDFENISEDAIQNLIERCLVRNSYVHFKKDYIQTTPRLKNLGKTFGDHVLKKNDQVYLIEVKLLPDKQRNPIRFQRAFINIAYLANEIKQNNVKGYFVLLDKNNTGYFEDKKFIEVCESHLNVKIKVHINWEEIDNNSESKVLIAEIYCP